MSVSGGNAYETISYKQDYFVAELLVMTTYVDIRCSFVGYAT